jgi:hypothetical protein
MKTHQDEFKKISYCYRSRLWIIFVLLRKMSENSQLGNMSSQKAARPGRQECQSRFYQEVEALCDCDLPKILQWVGLVPGTQVSWLLLFHSASTLPASSQDVTPSSATSAIIAHPPGNLINLSSLNQSRLSTARPAGAYILFMVFALLEYL